jgi:hypothetical protein
MSFIDTTAPSRSGIYPTLLQGQTPSTVVTSFMRTDSLQDQTVFYAVSTFNRVAGATGPKFQFRSYDEYLAYKKATYANRAT